MMLGEEARVTLERAAALVDNVRGDYIAADSIPAPLAALLEGIARGVFAIALEVRAWRLGETGP